MVARRRWRPAAPGRADPRGHTRLSSDREELAARIGEAAGRPGVAGVVSLLALDEAPLPGTRRCRAGLAGTLALVQALGDAGVGAPLWVLTRGAVAAGPGEVLASPVQARRGGWAGSRPWSTRTSWGGLIDLPPVLDERAAGRLCAVLAGCGEDQVAIRAAGILARRLVRAPLPERGRQDMGAGAARCWSPAGPGRWAGTWPGGWPGGARRGWCWPAGPAGRAGCRRAGADLAAAGTAVEVIACRRRRAGAGGGLLARIARPGRR